jgi:hypothetical protein
MVCESTIGLSANNRVDFVAQGGSWPMMDMLLDDGAE